jgi:hypothetical protein
VWDIIATERGDWDFNPEHLIGSYILGLPIEEILFFITVPYSCIFIYETVTFYIQEKKLNFNNKLFIIPSVLLVLLGTIFYDQNYTFTVSVFAAAFFLRMGTKFRGKRPRMKSNYTALCPTITNIMTARPKKSLLSLRNVSS